MLRARWSAEFQWVMGSQLVRSADFPPKHLNLVLGVVRMYNIDKQAASSKCNRATSCLRQSRQANSKRDPAYFGFGSLSCSSHNKTNVYSSCAYHSFATNKWTAVLRININQTSLARISAPRSLQADNNDQTSTFVVKFEDELRVIGLLSI